MNSSSTDSHTCSGLSGFVMLQTAPTSLAFPAANVLGVVRVSDWHAKLPLPLSALLPVRFAATVPRWVFTISAGTIQFPTLVSGPVRIRQFGPDALLSMPRTEYRGFAMYTRVVVVDEKPSALVVSPDAFQQIYRELDD